MPENRPPPPAARQAPGNKPENSRDHQQPTVQATARQESLDSLYYLLYFHEK
jgi:hypothetical protein